LVQWIICNKDGVFMHKSAVLAASAALGLAFAYAGSVYSAPSIYPVDTARFLAGSRFDFKVEFDGKVNEKDVRVLIDGKPAESVLGGKPGFVSEESGVGASAILLRGAHLAPGKYTVTAEAPDGRAEAKWDIYGTAGKPRARSVILLIADGLSVGHRTAARLLSKGVTNGKYNGALAMDDMPHMALLGTCSVDSIAADSANTASAYMTGHKSSVNALGVYCDRTKAPFDDPR
jgi:alkaline phosphatase